MIITTTPEVAGREIENYLGLVVGEAIMGVNVFRDIFASIRNIVGGRAGGYEASLAEGRRTAMTELEAHAVHLGGNAIVGVDIDYEVLGSSGGSMLLISVSGTAVKLRSKIGGAEGS